MSQTAGLCNGPNLNARAAAAGVTGRAISDYAKDPQYGPFLGFTVYAFPNATAAKSMMDSSATASGLCTSFTEPIADEPNGVETVTVAALSFPKVGDQTLAYRQSSDGGGGIASTGDVVYARSGRLVAVVEQAGTSIDSALTQQYVAKLMEKVRSIS